MVPFCFAYPACFVFLLTFEAKESLGQETTPPQEIKPYRPNIRFECDPLKAEVLAVPSLGRAARLGSLFNCSTSEFTKISILDENIPMENDSLISRIDIPRTETAFSFGNSINEKRELLDISASVTLDVVVSSVNIHASGSVKYLRDDQKKANSVTASLMYRIRTVEEVLEIFYNRTREYLNMAVLNTTTESHVVIGVDYGAEVIAKFEDKNELDEDLETIAGALEISINVKSKIFVSGSASVQTGTNETKSNRNYSFSFYGDLNFDGDDYPTDIDSVINLFKKVPRLVRQSNDGKGKQLMFYLMRTQRLRDYIAYVERSKKSTTKPTTVKTTTTTTTTTEAPDDGEALAGEAIEKFELINVVKFKLNDLQIRMGRNRNVLVNAHFRKLQRLRRKFDENARNYTSTVRTSMFEMRRGVYTQYYTERMRSAIREFGKVEVEQPLSSQEIKDNNLFDIEDVVDMEFRDQRLKIELYEFLSKKKDPDIKWVGRQDHLDTKLIQTFKKSVNNTVCMIHFHPPYLQNTVPFIQGVLTALAKNLTTLVVDCDFKHELCLTNIPLVPICELIFTPEDIAPVLDADPKTGRRMYEQRSSWNKNQQKTRPSFSKQGKSKPRQRLRQTGPRQPPMQRQN